MTASTTDNALRKQLAAILDSKDAHADFDTAIANMPAKDRGVRPEKLPYSAWQLLEHLRMAQHDILDFCVNPDYEEMKWPDDYWPASPEPPNGAAWEASIRQYREDRAALERMALDTSVDLLAKIPHGSGQTYLRELLLVADHAAYHLGELVILRRLLGNWNAGS
jgi:DinB family protein